MRSTVIGVYDEVSQAQAAIDELVRTGFGRKDIQLVSAEEANAADQNQAKTVSRDTDSGAGSYGSGKNVNLVFKSLFGGMEFGGSTSDQDYHGDIYSEAIRRGAHVLAVQSGNDEQHAEIINIMDRFNPIDIDDRVANWRAEGWSGRSASAGTGTTTTSITPGTTIRDDRLDVRTDAASSTAVSQPVVSQPSTMGSTADSAAINGASLTSSGNAVTRRSGVRVFPSEARENAGILSAGDSASDYENDYRDHWQSNYAGAGGRYEDHAPAYRYGSTLAGDDRFVSDSQWNDIEPQARTDWESRNAGHPWEKAKDAVRYSWERVSSRGRQ